MTTNGEKRHIQHLLFLGWEDHEVPRSGTDRDALLQLTKMSRYLIEGKRSSNPESQTRIAPRRVHCSDGSSRTGKFIALDKLLTELEKGRYDRYILTG